MKFRGPDEAVRVYFETREATSSPKAQSFGQRGREFAERCANRKCGRRGTREERYQLGARADYCKFCGAPWVWEESMIPSAVFSSGRSKPKPPRALELRSTLGRLLDELARTDEVPPGAAALYLYWIGRNDLGLRALAELAHARRIAGRGWTKSKAETAVRRSRDWLERRLASRGLLLELGE